MMDTIGIALAIFLGLVHIFADRIRRLCHIPPCWWMSIAGGVSTAYIFLDVFPELGESQLELEPVIGPLFGYLEHHVYLLALVGLGLFYGLEKLAVRSRRHRHKMQGEDWTGPGVFWVHTLSFASYSAILGYLLQEMEDHGLGSTLLLFIALALHFIVNDVGLREHHQRAYDRLGRWILAGAIVSGWLLGQAIEVSAAAIAATWALVSGGIILNVLKEELPENQESHFGAFAGGALIYALLLLVV